MIIQGEVESRFIHSTISSIWNIKFYWLTYVHFEGKFYNISIIRAYGVHK